MTKNERKASKNTLAISGSLIGLLSLFMVASSAFAGSGEATFKSVCKVCHAAGVMGAPKPGNANDWKPRLEKGIDAVHNNAIKGFKGKKGVMPAKGGRSSLSDDDVKAAIAYMIKGVQ